MSDTFESVSRDVERARSPSDIFGALVGDLTSQQQKLEKVYRCKVKIIHPDHNPPEIRELADEAFKLLTTWFTLAQEQIRNGRYGGNPTANPVTVRARTREYIVEEQIAQGDLCNLYDCTYEENGSTHTAVFKVTRNPQDNDLVANEARILNELKQFTDYDKFRKFLPELVDSFTYRDTNTSDVRQVNVLSFVGGGLVSLKEVQESYPQGVDPRDMAWMWRRLLVALDFAHHGGIVHGAVLPSHVLIQPQQHGLVLVDWSYAAFKPTATGERLKALSTEYESWYPQDVFDPQIPPLPGLDISMGARVMVQLLGGDGAKGVLPQNVPQSVKAFFAGCLLKGPRLRPQDAFALLGEFDELLDREYGKRKFRPFIMPTSGN